MVKKVGSREKEHFNAPLPLQVPIREPSFIPLSYELVLAGKSEDREWHGWKMGLQSSRVGSLDEQEGAGVSGVLLTEGGGMSFQAPYK